MNAFPLQQLLALTGHEEPFSRRSGKAFGVPAGKILAESWIHYLLPPGAFPLLNIFHSVTQSAVPRLQISWLSSGLRLSLDQNLTLGSPHSELLLSLQVRLGLPKVQDIAIFGLLYARSHGRVWKPRLLQKPRGKDPEHCSPEAGTFCLKKWTEPSKQILSPVTSLEKAALNVQAIKGTAIKNNKWSLPTDMKTY